MAFWQEGFLTTYDGVQLYQQRWHAPVRPKAALVLIHGLGEHSGRYTNLVSALNARDIAIYSMDNRGHGRTPGQRGFIKQWDDFREDVRSLIQLTAVSEPGVPLFLMGHSLGGLIAFEYALRYPGGLRGLILSAPGLSTEGISPVILKISMFLSKVWPTLSLPTGLDGVAISRNPEVVAAYKSDVLVHSVTTPRLASEGVAAIDYVLTHAPELKLPLLMLHGDADSIVPANATRSVFNTIPLTNKRYISYPGSYHEPHNDLDWQQVVQDIGDWIETQ